MQLDLMFAPGPTGSTIYGRGSGFLTGRDFQTQHAIPPANLILEKCYASESEEREERKQD